MAPQYGELATGNKIDFMFREMAPPCDVVESARRTIISGGGDEEGEERGRERGEVRRMNK